ncbi:hypothetical protein [Bradyrhizobium sp. SYSU BS000235]|uniref:hypothetical protein n=1 Tax=Bradyrhizobium sp. SYSU BS000235 TaxID=3411332 RepID=UPI003C774D45
MQTLLIPERDIFTPSAQTLFVFCGFQGGQKPRTNILWRIARRLRLTAIGDNARRIRDYHANPRSFDYMLGVAAEFRAANKLTGPVYAMIDKAFAPGSELANESFAAPAEQFEFGDVEAIDLWSKRNAIKPAAIVLLYADAIGLGCGKIQDAALAGSALVVVANGRRRAFVLDRSARRALSLRRFLSNWRFMEIFFAMAFLAVAAVGSVIDATQSKKA